MHYLTEAQQRAWDAVNEHGGIRPACRALGASYNAIRGAYEIAKRKMELDPAIRESMGAVGTGLIPTLAWAKTKSKDGTSYSVLLRPGKDESETLLEKVAAAFDGLQCVAVPPPVDVDGDHLTVYPLYDMHIGMMAWGRETRGQDFDLKLMKADLMQSIAKVMKRSPDSSDALIILGGDTIHVNDHFNETPASRHHQDADGRFEKIIDVAIEAISGAIELVAQKHASVKVVVLRGNHDETSHIVLKASLKQRYRETAHISFPVLHGWDKSEIFWMAHGDTLIVAHHGDKMKPERLALIAADKCPDWSGKTCRVILTGHLHSLKVMDMPGVTHYTLRAFCPPDAYGANFGGVRGLSAMTFDKIDGLVVSAHDPINRKAA
jgi:predicted phosphodiesterase